MTENKKPDLKVRMQALHEKYCRLLPGKYLEIEDCWQNYRQDLTNPDYSETFYRLIHTLKGTSATFGFTTQSDICFEIQKIILTAKESDTPLSDQDVLQIQQHLNTLKEKISEPADEIPY